ncbi:unnamed protein product [Allacma fusca]|uniref:Uncharacterized protein n=1 Tax=Allacma fusca TaxID=39272 RepID=A0A8J2PQI6_9HEXA|nr:unnamed protein product [Allacma fusca]
MAFQEREVCCCGTRVWTLVIGWIEIILSTIMLFMTMVSLVVLSTSAMNPSQYGYISNGQRLASYKPLIVAEVIVTILYALNVFMNVVLLRGTYKKNPHQINAWLIFTLIFTIIAAVMI